MSETENVENEKSGFELRSEAFIKEYGELVAKHNIDFATYPMFVPDGSGGFRVVVQTSPVDMTEQPQKSPIIVSQ